MKILIIGAGVIGTVYGAQLAAAGHDVSVRAHGPRTDDIARDGLIAVDVAEDREVRAAVQVVAGSDTYDLILVAVGRDQLGAACATLTTAAGRPTVVIFGNNPNGSGVLPGSAFQGFPGIGGVLVDGVARYVRISQQPTTIGAGDNPALTDLVTTLRRRDFAVTRVADMDGWLAYHATFVACVAAALTRCGIDPRRLAADRPTLRLMCHAITEGFRAQKATGRGGLPRNLAMLHHRLLLPVAVEYWARTMRSPTGELCFAAHTRHAGAEMRAIAADVLTQLADQRHTGRLHLLLDPAKPTVAGS